MRDDPVLGALAEQHAELDSLIADLDEAGWATPSRCEGWSVADVVLHLAQTDDMALASVEGRFPEFIAGMAEAMAGAASLDDGVDLMVQQERGAPGAAIAQRWRDGAATLRDRLAETDPSARLEWVAGTLSARTLTTTRLAECWIHTGDVATGLGVARVPSPQRLWQIARLAWRTLPHAFAREGQTMTGPVAFELEGPDGPWRFADEGVEPVTTIRGDANELCLVAARRVPASQTGLTGDGPDADAVLSLMRTWA